ncbi:hypothetical protein ACGTN9_16340 [Halobacillus sp. MO56]
MIWLMFLVPLALLIAIAIYIEKRGNKAVADADMTIQDKEMLTEEYLDRSAQSEVHRPKNKNI